MEVASHEAIVRQAYQDSAGVWTWSIGLTSASGHNVERYIGDPQPLQHCLDVYVWALRRYAQQVLRAFDGVELTPEQFAAALSFHWNTGAISRATWVKEFKAGRVAVARQAIMNWKSPPEIETRRRREQALFFDGEWHNDGTMTEFTRLTTRNTPDWGSGKRIDVSREMRQAFGKEMDAADSKKSPGKGSPKPTTSPDKEQYPMSESKYRAGNIAFVVIIIAIIVAALALTDTNPLEWF